MADVTVNELRELIARVLDESTTPEAQVVALEHYVERFDLWFGALDLELLKRDDAKAGEARDLLAAHGRVIDHAAKLKGEASQAVKNLRSRGKKILAYAPTAGAPATTPRRKG